MRIALLTSSYAPAVGGVEEFVAKLAHRLRCAGDDVEVWTHGTDDAVTDTVDGILVRRFDFPLPRAELAGLVRLPAQASLALLRLRRAHAAFRPDVLNVHCFSGNGVYGTALSALTGTPLVVSLHGETLMDDHDIFDRSQTLRAGLRVGLRRARAVTACSAMTLADAEERFGLQAGRGHVVHNAVELDEGPLEPVDLPFPSYVLGMGRLVPKKGLDLLIRAFAAARTDRGLVIAGRGPEACSLRALATELGIAHRVHFTGVLTRAQVAWAMAHADAFVLPSRIEPFGLVALEAWRAGTALLATTRGGPSEFVKDGVDAVLINPEDVAAVADALTEVLADDDRRRRLANAGKARLPDFDWSRVAMSLRGAYEEAAGPLGA